MVLEIIRLTHYVQSRPVYTPLSHLFTHHTLKSFNLPRISSKYEQICKVCNYVCHNFTYKTFCVDIVSVCVQFGAGVALPYWLT